MRGELELTKQRKAALYEISEAIHPHSVRAAAYQLFRPYRLIPDMSKGSTNKVSGLLVQMREDGVIPWYWVTDESRVFERYRDFGNPAIFLRYLASAYRSDWWEDQERLVIAVAEKATIAGVARPALIPYRVPFLVVHGNSSATAIRDLAQLNRRDGRPMTVLYLGDWDCAGVFMSIEDLPNRLFDYGATDVEVVRVGVHLEQISEMDALFSAQDQLDERLRELEKKGKTTDAFAVRLQTFIDQYGPDCAELDALDPRVLREALTTKIEASLDLVTFIEAEDREIAEQHLLDDFFDGWDDFVDERTDEARRDLCELMLRRAQDIGGFPGLPGNTR